MTHAPTNTLRALVLGGSLLLASACLPQGNGGGGGTTIIDSDAGGSDASTSPDLGGCVPDCTGRTCGEDPVCGASCGACDGTCSDEGVCDQSSGEGAPQIVSLTTNITSMGPDDTLVISAVVTDPQGASDLLGGQLFDSDGQASYGSFSSPTPGSYELQLSWQQLRTLQEIQAPAGGISRTFRATFFDQSGASSSRDITLRLACDAPGDAICAGACADLQTDDDNCGSCGNSNSGELTCENGTFGCPQGTFECEGSCVPEGDLDFDDQNCGACGNDCLELGNRLGNENAGYCEQGVCILEVQDDTNRSCDDICSSAGTVCISEDYACDGTTQDIASCVPYQGVDGFCFDEKPLRCADPLLSSGPEPYANCSVDGTVQYVEGSRYCFCTQ